MPAPKTPGTAEVANAAEETVQQAEKSFRELADRIEKLVKDGLETLRTQSRTYAEGAGERLETAQKYVTEHVQERPLTATVTALGVGVLIGLLLGSGRQR
ncbi:DUF883 family protein [Phenylobacterium montanum]|uniref:DUF883 family protein n=1 Tax=Phenylobacterium montanum TaxID=2823693 RepID=A0A975FYJ1_9CAUL|nr:DUF883 family protein [Caulobacter sp. S6]QUD87640.1 DUF883 family protein [Caulobacter sp. S6]